jgi:hypothetical protein
MDWRSAFAGLSTAASVTATVDALVRGRRGAARALLFELQKNINLIYLWRNDGVSPEKIIGRLETRQYESALSAGFDFSSLKRKVVLQATAGGVPGLMPYVGWSTEQLCENIYLKIHALKTLVEIDSRRSPARLNARLHNLLKLMLLFIRHIRSR